MVLKGLNQVRLGEKMGLSQVAISYKICGRTRFTQDDIQGMINALSLDADETMKIFFDGSQA
jgi:transcriptional regulator with XRE-family HTH domain